MPYESDHQPREERRVLWPTYEIPDDIEVDHLSLSVPVRAVGLRPVVRCVLGVCSPIVH